MKASLPEVMAFMVGVGMNTNPTRCESKTISFFLSRSSKLGLDNFFKISVFLSSKYENNELAGYRTCVVMSVIYTLLSAYDSSPLL